MDIRPDVELQAWSAARLYPSQRPRSSWCLCSPRPSVRHFFSSLFVFFLLADKLLPRYNFVASAVTPIPPTMPASRVGRDPQARPTATAANYVPWPPAGVLSISPLSPEAIGPLPRYTPTGTALTLTGAAAPTVSGHALPAAASSRGPGNGWANDAPAATGWYAPVSGCPYLGPYDGFSKFQSAPLYPEVAILF
jgi:hypothetical protein